MLDERQRATLIAIERLTREDYSRTTGTAVAAELTAMGVSINSDMLVRILEHLSTLHIASRRVMAAGPGAFWDVELTDSGRAEAQQVDPFERVMGEARHTLSSAKFSAACPEAFKAWAAAERLLWDADSASKLTTVGHSVREAMQAFATSMVVAHDPPDVDPDVAHVERRLGAVIHMHRGTLGEARREALEALGTLWEKVNRLVQRQEHGAQREDEPVTWSDARRIVYLTMFCMVEFIEAFESCAGRAQPSPRTLPA